MVANIFFTLTEKPAAPFQLCVKQRCTLVASDVRVISRCIVHFRERLSLLRSSVAFAESPYSLVGWCVLVPSNVFVAGRLVVITCIE